MKEKDINSYEQMRQQALEDCRAAVDLIPSRSSSQEATEYKQWTVSVAEKVAMATTEGGFLGFGGDRLSANEKQLLGEIESTLGVQSTLA
ncbi:MAG: hypothetical protein ACREYE_06850 [Gammaproteobacteria bacterium]